MADKLRGRAVRLARWTHAPEVVGSTPTLVTNLKTNSTKVCIHDNVTNSLV